MGGYVFLPLALRRLRQARTKKSLVRSPISEAEASMKRTVEARNKKVWHAKLRAELKDMVKIISISKSKSHTPEVSLEEALLQTHCPRFGAVRSIDTSVAGATPDFIVSLAGKFTQEAIKRAKVARKTGKRPPMD